MALSVSDDFILHNRIHPLVTGELIARARARPYPPYDPDIAEVLDFVRRNPDPERPRYLIVQLSDGFALARRAQMAGLPPVIVDDARHPDRGAAEHAVLEQRLRDLGVTWSMQEETR
jgi:hypothetical protein